MTNRKKNIKKRTPFGLKRKWFLTMMSLLMVFQILGSSFFVLAAENNGSSVLTISELNLTLDGETVSGKEIASIDKLELFFKFNINLNITEPASESVTVLTLPEEIQLSDAISDYEVTTTTNGTTITLGELNSSGKDIQFTFADFDTLETGMASGEVSVWVSLDMDEIGDSQNVEIQFETASNAPAFKIGVSDNIPKEPEIKKEGNITGDVIDWKEIMGGSFFVLTDENDDSGVLSLSDWKPTVSELNIILDGETISGKKIASTDKLNLSFKFDIMLDINDPGAASAIGNPGNTYTVLTLPEEIQLSDALSHLTVTTTANGTPITLGELNGVGKEVQFTFKDFDTLKTDIESAGKNGIGSAEASVQVSLDMDKIGDRQNVEIRFETVSNAPTFSVGVSDNTPKEPEIKKEGRITGDVIDWKVTITMGGKEYEGDFTFQDEIGTKHSYVPDSFKVDGSPVDDSNLTITRADNHSQSLTYTYTPTEEVNTKGKEILYEYQTKVNPSAYTNDKGEMVNSDGSNEVKIENTAKFSTDNGTTFIAEKKSVPFNIARKWMQKVGTPVAGSKTGEVKWDIIINTNDCSFNSITLHDKLAYPLQLEGNIIYQYNNGASQNMGVGFELTGGEKFGYLLGGDGGYKFDSLNGVREIVVTYRTNFGSEAEFEAYKRTNGQDPENEAWVTWEWDNYWGEGPGTGSNQVGIPSVSKPTGVISGIIKKSGTYNPATQTIKWEITVNGNKVTINDFEVKDVIPEGQNYVKGSFESVDSNLAIEDDTDGLNEITIKYTGSTTEEKTFSFQTRITDKSFYADNAKKEFTNTAKLYENDILMEEVTAKVPCESKVIEKTAGDYDYSTQKLSWTIVVNQNKEAMDKIQVVDTLPQGVTLDTNSVKYTVTGGNKPVSETALSNTGTAPGYSYSNNILTIYLKDMDANDGQVTVTYTTDVDRDKIDGFKNGGSETVIKNSAALKNNYGYQDVVSGAEKKIKSNALSKTGVIPSNNKSCIEYTVKINGSQVTLPQGSYIEDTLPDGIQLDLTSVKLYEANVSSQGDITTNTQVDSSKYKITSTAAGGGKIKFKLMLPSDCGNKAYVLSYRTLIIDKDKAPFGNNVAVSGLGFNPQATHSLTKEYVNKNYSGISLFNGTRLEITVVDDKDDAQKLEGAVFELLYEGNVIKEAVTDANGKVTFYGLTDGKTYTIRQKTAPGGYVIPSLIGKGKDVTVAKGTNTLEVKNGQQQQGSGGNNNSGNTSEGNYDAGGNHGGDANNDNGDSNAEEIMEKADKSSPAKEADEAGTAIKTLPKTGGVWGTGIIYLLGGGIFILGIAGMIVAGKNSELYKKAGIVAAIVGVILILITLSSNLLAISDKRSEIESFEKQDLTVAAVTVKDLGTNEKEETDYDSQVEALLNENGVMAVLSIPSISCKEVIREGSSKGTLAKALGHMEGTAFPGQIGNCAIAGHRNYNFGMYFNRLDEVELDDEITISTQTDTFTYKVTEIKVVEPEDLSVLEQGDDTRVTLITCTPLYIATHRLIVIGELI